MLCCFKVLEIIPSFPNFSVTPSLSLCSFVNYALFYLTFNSFFSGIYNNVELRILTVDGNGKILLSKFV